MSFDTSKPIDFVMIWVDGNDPEWRREKAKYDGSVITTSNSEVRFRDWDNLQYWFRSVEKFAPWVNKIHFVTWGHLPEWLDTTNPKLNIVKHSDYIPEEYLPTFSSHTIELNLHRIEGLAEQFVYFNDDIFLTAPVKPEDFFKNGKPCDTVAQDCIFFGKDSAGPFNGADITVINSHFKKKAVIKNNLGKWLSPKNSFRNVVKTLLLYPWPWFPGLYYQHASNSFLKSTFETVWAKEFEALDETCSHRFRKSGDLNQWVMKFWQQAEGNFEVRPEKFAYCYHVKESNFNALCEDIPSGRRAMLCINDTSKTKHFEDKKKKLKEVFEDCFPEISSFERAEYYENLPDNTENIDISDLEQKKIRAQRDNLLEAISAFAGFVKFAENSKAETLSKSRQLFVLGSLEKYIKVQTPIDKLLCAEELAEYVSLLKKVVSLIDEDVLAKSEMHPCYKLFIYQLKKGTAPNIVFSDDDALLGYNDDRYSLSDGLRLWHLKIKDNKLCIRGTYSAYNALPDDVSVSIYANDNMSSCKCEELDAGICAIGKRIQRKISFSAEIPLFEKGKTNICFKLKIDGRQIPLKNIAFGQRIALSNILTKTYYSAFGFNVTTDGEVLRVIKSGVLGKLLCEIKFLCQIVLRNRRGGIKAVFVRCALPILRLFSKKTVYLVEGTARELDENAVNFHALASKYFPEAKVMLVVPEGYKNENSLLADDALLEKETRKYKRTLLLSKEVFIDYPPEVFYNPFRKRYGYYKDIMCSKSFTRFYYPSNEADRDGFYASVLKERPMYAVYEDSFAADGDEE